MLRPILSLVISIVVTTALFGQREGDNWVFGWNAGLRFMPDSSITFYSSAVHTREGVASISDRNTGELLFYTDGRQVWDRNHGYMPNGFGLMGNYSAAQSSVIIPKPGSTTRYYIFTAPQLNETDVPYAWSEVDMSLNNGLGDVLPATKNTPMGKDATEKLTVARHCNNRDFWVVMRHANGNRFSVRLVDQNGVQAPTEFSLGGFLDNSSWNKANYLKFSQDQRLLVHPIGPLSLDNYHSTIEIFAFDNATGTITGPLYTIDGLQYAYAAEFSADNRLLYVSDISTQGTSYVHQYDLGAGSPLAIKASRTILAQDDTDDYGALQIGPDGKIYVAKEFGYDNGSTRLDVIHFPSVKGPDCTYEVNGLQLQHGQSLIGLPNIPNYVYRKAPEILTVKHCPTGTFRFSLNHASASASVSWLFGDPGSGNANTAAGTTVEHAFSLPGQYSVQAIHSTPCGADTAHLLIDVRTPLLADTAFCQGGTLTLTGPTPNTYWNFNYTGPTLTVTTPGPVVYQFADDFGCLIIDTISVQQTPPLSSTETLLLCQGDTAVVFGQPVTAAGTYSMLLAASNGCDSVHTVQVFMGVDTIRVYENLHVCRGDTAYRLGVALFEDGTYTLDAPPVGNCAVRHYITVAIRELPVITAAVTESGCTGHPIGRIELLNLMPGTQIRINRSDWLSGNSFSGLVAAAYQVELRDVFGCVQEAEVEVPEPWPYSVNVAMDTSRADCGLVPLRATHTSPHPVVYAWSPTKGLDCTDCAEVVSMPKSDTEYTVITTDTAGCTASASVIVPYRYLFHLYAPNAFSPNDDGVHDRFTLYGSLCVQMIRSLSVFDRWGGEIFHGADLTPGEEQQGWDGYWRNSPLSPGVYTWIARVELYDGEIIQLSGTVTVIR